MFSPQLVPLLLLALPLPTFSQFTLQLNTPFEFDPQAPSSSTLRPITFLLPSSPSPLAISVALCGETDNGPRFFATNNSAIASPGAAEVNGADVLEITVGANGTGWVVFGAAQEGGMLVVDLEGADGVAFEVGVGDDGPLHTAISLPLFGDSTQNQAIIFSAALPLPLPSIPSPTFPNYTLPPADLAYPPPPDGVQFAGLNVTLVMAPTNGSPAGASMSACALRRLQGAREVGSEGAQVGAGTGAGTGEARLIVRGEEGWRVQWLIEGLEPQTNYTAYVIESGTKVGGPIWFVTKDAAFSCTLLHTLPFCPRVSYAIPLSPPAGSSATSLDSTNLDPAITAPILEYMTNFTASLLTFACGRDWYSPVQTCESCQRTYRDWICAVSFPRCGEAVPPAQAQPDTDAQRPLSRPRPALLSQTPQTPLSASQLARNPALAALSSFASQSWTALLPCLETCHAVDRACPDFLGFRCPVPRFTAARSYGVGYVDGDGNGEVGGGKGDWVQGGGAVGVAQDRWGNVWCNG